jgi:hypothetical protein
MNVIKIYYGLVLFGEVCDIDCVKESHISSSPAGVTAGIPSDGLCLVTGCSNKVFSLGYCKKHHNRLSRYHRIHTLAELAILKEDESYNSLETCVVPGCTNKASIGNICYLHDFWIKRFGSPEYKGAICEEPGCPYPVISRGLCHKHYQGKLGTSFLYNKKICCVAGCKKPPLAHGYCSFHYYRLLRYGIVYRKGEKPVSTKGTGVCCVDGCDDVAVVNGRCHLHNFQFLRGRLRGKEDKVVNCNETHGTTVECDAVVTSDAQTSVVEADGIELVEDDSGEFLFQVDEKVGDIVDTSEINLCCVSDCDEPEYAFGYCDVHYERLDTYGIVYTSGETWKRNVKKNSVRCSVDGCSVPAEINGYCHLHNFYNQRYGSPTEYPKCSEDGCDLAVKTNGMCLTHYIKYCDSCCRDTPVDVSVKAAIDGSGNGKILKFTPVVENNGKCSFPGCSGDIFGSGLCRKHFIEACESPD